MNPLLSGLAANPALPPDLVDRLIAVADDDLAADLAARPDLTRAQAVALVSRHEESAWYLAQGKVTAADIDPARLPLAALALLGQGAGPPEWARLFASDPAVERRERLAACPGLPADVVETLAADADARVVEELALWTTPETAAGLATHPYAEVRRAVAVNEATPPAVLAALLTGDGLPPAERCRVCDREETPFVHDPHCPRPDCDLPPDASCDGSHRSALHAVREAALRNPATPAEAVVAFTDDPSPLRRSALAARSDLPAEVYARLAEDASPLVRADLAGNPAIAPAVMRVLATDRADEVRRAVAHHPRVPLDTLASLAGGTRIGAGLPPRVAAASPAEVERLAASPDPAVRMLVARRRDLPAAVRDALATDPDAKVVASLAPHPGLSEARLRAMADRHGGRVAAAVASNPDAPPALLEDLARHRPTPRKALHAIAGHRHAPASALLACLEDAKARPLAAGHPSLPPRTLVELLTDPDERVAEAAAANPSLPAVVREGLVP
ncbi:hypothetical protein ACWGIN_02765 [Streptomyces sp. NPDC054861]